MKPWQFWMLNLLAALCLALAVGNAVLAGAVRAKQADTQTRQAFIAESVQLSRLNQELIQTLANLAASTDDAAIKALLASQGISYSVRGDAAAGSTAADAAPASPPAGNTP